MSLRLLVPPAVVATVLGLAGPALAQEPVAEVDGLSSVDAYGDVVVWSEQQDEEGSVIGPYYLVASVDGKAPQRLPVEPRSVPFDADLGPDARGDVVAVYSRCDDEPSTSASGFVPSAPYPAYTRGRGCDVYRYDFASQRESKVEGASTDQASEVLPSIWRDEIAFARVYEAREGKRGRYPYLYVRPLDGGGSERQPGGSRGENGLPGPTSLDLYGRRLSFVWNYRGGAGVVSEVRLDTVGGSNRVLSSTESSGIGQGQSYATYLSPQGTQGRIFYAHQRVRGGPEGVASVQASLVLSYRISEDNKAQARAPRQTAGVATTDRDGFFFAQRSDFLQEDVGTTTILRADDLDFID